MAKHVLAEWERYETQAMPALSSDVQKTESMLAFFAGAGALFKLLTEGMSEGEEPEEEDLQMMTDINDELREFVDHVVQILTEEKQ